MENSELKLILEKQTSVFIKDRSECDMLFYLARNRLNELEKKPLSNQSKEEEFLNKLCLRAYHIIGVFRDRGA